MLLALNRRSSGVRALQDSAVLLSSLQWHFIRVGRERTYVQLPKGDGRRDGQVITGG